MVDENTSKTSRGPDSGLNPLSPSERRYLEENELGGYKTPTKLIDSIETKMNELPARIDALCRDIELIASGDPRAYGVVDEQERPPDFFSLERWEDGWLELMGFEDTPTRAELQRALQYQPADFGPGSAPAEFGAKLGKMARDLMITGDFPVQEITSSQIYQELVWGFIWEMSGGELFWPRKKWYELGDSLGEELSEMVEQRMRDAGDVRAEEMKNAEPLIRSVTRVPAVFEHVETVLSENGIENEWTVEEVKNLILEQYEMVELTTSGDSLSEILSQDELLELVEEHQVEERQALRNRLAIDADRLRNQSYRRTDAETVFRTIFDEDIETNRDLRQELDQRQKDPRGPKIAKDLTGRNWDSIPLLTKIEDEWQLTNYGRVLGHYLREAEKPKLARDALPSDAVEEVLQEWEGIDEVGQSD